MTTSGTSAVFDNGRFALDFLQSAVRSAGYMACNTTHSQLSLLNAGSSAMYYNFGQPLGGYEANNTVSNAYTIAAPPVTPDASTGDWLASSGPAWPGGGLDAALSGKVIKNSDVLVVYSTLRTNSPPAVVTSISNGASSFQVQNPYNLANGQIAVIADCAKSMVFQISTVVGTTVSFATSGTPGNTAASFPVSFQVGAQVTPIDTTVYYIGKGADGDGALFSSDLNATSTFTASELVSDIENMRVLYGVDTTGTQTVAEYIPAPERGRFQLGDEREDRRARGEPAGRGSQALDCSDLYLARQHGDRADRYALTAGVRDHRFNAQHGRLRRSAAMRHQRNLNSPSSQRGVVLFVALILLLVLSLLGVTAAHRKTTEERMARKE